MLHCAVQFMSLAPCSHNYVSCTLRTEQVYAAMSVLTNLAVAARGNIPEIVDVLVGSLEDASHPLGRCRSAEVHLTLEPVIAAHL